jgi:hypothetical protein
MSDREILHRQVVKKLEPGSYLDFSYSIEDERAPIKAGTKRMNTLYGSLVRPKPGSDGKQTEIVRMMLLDINIHGWGAGLVLKKVAKGSSVPAAGPLVKLKRDMIRLLREVRASAREAPPKYHSSYARPPPPLLLTPFTTLLFASSG